MPAEAEEGFDAALPRVDLRKLRSARPQEMAVRFALGAVVSVTAGIIATAVGARFGGMFLAFPAILPASLTFVEKKEGTHTADRDALGAVLGGFALVVFAAVGEAMFGHHASALVIGMALVAWLLGSCCLYAVVALIRPDKCNRYTD